MDRTLYNASGCKDKTAHDAICSASKPQTLDAERQRGRYVRKDGETSGKRI